MELAGFVSRIYDAAMSIDFGRKGFAARGKAEEGRISYERGISEALSTFRDAQSTADPHTVILVEYTFINQELQNFMRFSGPSGVLPPPCPQKEGAGRVRAAFFVFVSWYFHIFGGLLPFFGRGIRFRIFSLFFLFPQGSYQNKQKQGEKDNNKH